MIDTFALRQDQALTLLRSARHGGSGGQRRATRWASLAALALAGGLALGGPLLPTQALAQVGPPPDATPPAEVRQSVTAQLEPLGGSGVAGTATFSAAGDYAHAPRLDDATQVMLNVIGLAPGATAQALLSAGTCELPGASAAQLPALTADATGAATATGMVLFRGAENVSFSAIADGDHIVTITSDGVPVACAAIPTAT